MGYKSVFYSTYNPASLSSNHVIKAIQFKIKHIIIFIQICIFLTNPIISSVSK